MISSSVVPIAFIGGMLVALAAANVVLGAMMRDRTAPLFGASVFAYAARDAARSSVVWNAFAPHAPAGVRAFAVFLASLAFATLAVAFCEAFLDLARTLPGAPRVLRALLTFYAAATATSVFVRGERLAELAYVATCLLLAAALLCGILTIRRGRAGPRAYVVGFAGLVVGVVAADGVSLRAGTPVLWGGVGVAWQAIFLSAALAAHVRALASRAAALEDAVNRDPLTGVANRRALDATLQDEWRRATRTRSPLAIVLVDVDAFKAYNDGYGHQSGDEVLARVASAMREALQRPEDVLARYGGEEFVVVLPGCTTSNARRIAHRIRMSVRALAIRHAGSAHGVVTVSAGVAGALPRLGGEADDLIRAADGALYEAKRNGRDRVEVALGSYARSVAST